MNKKFFYIFLVLFMSFGVLHAQWLEYESPVVGNFSMNTYGNNAIHEIPNSHYFLISDGSENLIGNNIAILDIETGRIRNSIKRDYKMNHPVILPDPDSGWNIYYHGWGTSTLGMLHIDAHGEFGNEMLLRKTMESPVLSAEVLDRAEVWFIGDCIYRLTIRDDLWTEFTYPEGWDHDIAAKYGYRMFKTEDNDTLFAIFYGNTEAKYQMMMLNLITGHTSIFIPPDDDFLSSINSIKDIKEWKGHDGLYLILTSNSIWIYNALTGYIHHYIDDLITRTSKIMQTGDGKFMYLFGREDTSLKIINLEDKSIEKKTFLLEEGWIFDYSFAEMNRENGQLITLLVKGDIGGRNKPVVINLADLSLIYVPGIVLKHGDFKYLKEHNVLIVSGDESPIYITFLDSGEIKSPIQLNYQADNWSVMVGRNYPTLLNNMAGSTFCRFLPPCKREMFDIDIQEDVQIYNACQFPCAESAIIYGYIDYEIHYFEYIFDDGTVEEIEGLILSNLYSDPSNNQIVGLFYGSIYFIKPHGKVRKSSYPPPEGFTFYSSIFDPDNNAVWITYYKPDTLAHEVRIDKISTVTYLLEDSIDISFGYNFHYPPRDVKIDPSQRYFYFIDRDWEAKTRELVILNLEKKSREMVLNLQRNVDDEFHKHTYPCIVNIPEQEKLFIWDGNGSWSIDTESMEVLYGEVKDDPQELYWGGGNIITKGIWDSQKERILVIDDTFDATDDPSRVLEFDLDTGEITREIELPQYFDKAFFPGSKDKIIFLDSDESKVYTLHLDPAWENPATVQPKTNYLQFGIGDNARFTLHIKNGETEHNVTAYVWLITPNGDMLFMTPGNVIPELRSFPLILPANIDVDWDILNFSVPEILPEGFYNFNAFFVNERFDRGPIGTWNFYVKD